MVTEVTREEIAKSVQAWAETVAQGLETLSAEEQSGVLREVVNEITVDCDNNLVITIAIPLVQEEQQITFAGITIPMGQFAKRLHVLLDCIARRVGLS